MKERERVIEKREKLKKKKRGKKSFDEFIEAPVSPIVSIAIWGFTAVAAHCDGSIAGSVPRAVLGIIA